MTFDEKELDIIRKALVSYRMGDWRQVRSVYDNEVKPLDELMEKVDAWNKKGPCSSCRKEFKRVQTESICLDCVNKQLATLDAHFEDE